MSQYLTSSNLVVRQIYQILTFVPWCLLIFACTCCIPSLSVLAEESYSSIVDKAEVLSAQTESQLADLARETEAKTTAQVVVMTVPSLGGSEIETFATAVFNEMGIGQIDVNNGILFLIAPTDRRTRIEVGYGLEQLFTDSLSGEILDTYVLPYFRQGNIEGGVIAGMSEISRILLQYPEAARGVTGSTPWYVRTKGRDFTNSLYLLGGTAAFILLLSLVISKTNTYPLFVLVPVLVLALGTLGLSLYTLFALGSYDNLPIPQLVISGVSWIGGLTATIRQYKRYGPRMCDSCGTHMTLLSEVQDNQHLNAVQKLEENLGSVDYDIWHCSACLRQDTEKYVKMFSSFGSCPKCSAQTFKETTEVLVHATSAREGKKRIDGKCFSCSHQSSRVERISRITTSSGSGGSSGGSSSGGGRSGGGGASRSW